MFSVSTFPTNRGKTLCKLVLIKKEKSLLFVISVVYVVVNFLSQVILFSLCFKSKQINFIGTSN